MSSAPRRARYQEIADDLRGKILDGTYPLDSALPSTAQLMGEYGVSNTVVQRAINELKHEGVLEGQAGKGVFVLREPAPAEPSDGYSAVMGQIESLRETFEGVLRDLDDRVTQLEAAARELRAQRKPS